METKALLVLDTWSTSTEFKTDLINTMKSNGLNIITDLEATDIVLALNYMTSLIYSYYKNYYLSNASKERTLELMSITASGKLNFYASELKAYKDAYAHDFKSLGGNENSSSHDTTLNRSGKSKQATTPETIAKGSDYIDDYSSSEQKYENSNKETGTRSYNSTIKGSEQDYWKNIISIPKRLFEDIIGSFSKFFFSSSMELTPCAVLTIEQALQKMKEEIKNIDTTTKTEIETLSTLIKKTQTQVSNLEESVTLIDSNVQKLDNKITKTNTNLENLTKVTPTDIGVKDRKLGLKHDTTWLTNQDAITLGNNLIYDGTTKTLNAKGGNLPFPLEIEGTYGENGFETINLTRYQVVTIISKYNKSEPLILRINFNANIASIKIDMQNISALKQVEENATNYIFVSLVTVFLFSTINILVEIDTSASTIRFLNKTFLNSSETSLYLNNNGLSIDSSYLDTPSSIGKVMYFDKINNQSIIHENETEVKNYIIGDYTAFQEDDHSDYVKILLKKNNVEEYYGGYVPKSLNVTATPKVLRSVNNSMSWVELPKYYEHDGMLKVNSNYIMFKYISNDSVAQTDFSQLINDFSGNYITASGSFVLGTDQIAMVYGIDFDTLTLSCNVLDMSTHNLGSDDIVFSDLKIGTYSENVRLIQ